MQNVDVDLDVNFAKLWGVFWAGILVRALSLHVAVWRTCAQREAAAQPGCGRRGAGVLACFPAEQGHSEMFP